MHPTSSRFADPLKDYGFDPSTSAQDGHTSLSDSDDPPLSVLNSLIGLSRGLNLLPDDPFDGQHTPGSCVSRSFDWLKDFTVGARDEGFNYDDVHPKDLFDGAPLADRLDFFLYGHTDPISHADERFGSWELPESHPLKPSLVCPGRPGFYVNTNWHERIQWAYRCSLPRGKSSGSLYVLGTDEEHELLLEIGRFRKAATYGATKLLISLLHSGIHSYPAGYLDIQDPRFPLAERFYAKKFPDDRQFVQDGIVYTVVVGGNFESTSIPYTVAKKLYSNDQKGKQAICEALYSKGSHDVFAFPTQCMLDFMGIRVVAEPLLPLKASPPYDLVDELLRDCKCPSGNVSIDISSSLFNSSELCKCLKDISNYLNLSSWPIPFEGSDVEGLLSKGTHANVQRCDGRLHIRQTHEVLPLILEPNVSVDPLYSLRFRPELCYNYKKGLKCTLRSHVIFNDSCEGDIFKDAFDHMMVVLEDAITRFDRLLDSWDISHVFHSLGINIRYLGVAYEKAVYAGLKNLLAAEMVARAVKHLWDVKLNDYFSEPVWSLDTVMRDLLSMVNDVFGVFSNSSDFWSQSIIPEIARHFNLVKLEGISHRVIPHSLLKSALEYNLCILLPPMNDGDLYRRAVTSEDFTSVDMHPLMSAHIDSSESSRSNPVYDRYKAMVSALFPKMHVVYPSREATMYKVAYKLWRKDVTRGIGELILSANPQGLGFCQYIESKLIGKGYPCDPACVYNSELSCVNHQQSLTGINLYCLAECLLQLDVIKRFKMVLYMGYEYLRHRQLDDALRCALYVRDHTPSLCAIVLEAEILALQCYCFMKERQKCNELYEKLLAEVKRIEPCNGLLSLQLAIIDCFEAWWRNDYAKCVSYAGIAKEAAVRIAGLPQYEWLEVAMTSILGHCYERLGRNVEATHTQREVVRLCRVLQLPRYAVCHLTWMFVEYLLRNDFYEEGCPLSMELITVLEHEFGSLSVECLRCLYVSAWANHQVGCAHFVHPFLFLSNSDRIIGARSGISGISGSVILDEFVEAASCPVRRSHCENALGLYKSLYERLCMVYEQCRREVIEYVRTVCPSTDLEALECLAVLNRKTFAEKCDNRLASSDKLLWDMLLECEKYYEHILLVIKNLLTLKVISLSSQHSMIVAQGLYNAYASQVSGGYIRKMCVGSEADMFDRHSGYKPASMYGSGLSSRPETFNASVSMEEKNLPHRGHELRSIEELLLKEPTSSVAALCEVCHLTVANSEATPADWFDRLFDLGAWETVVGENKFLLGLDTLRHFLTPSKRLIILSYVANISNVEVDITLTFMELRSKLVEVMTH